MSHSAGAFDGNGTSGHLGGLDNYLHTGILLGAVNTCCLLYSQHCGYKIMEKEEVEANGVTTKEEPVAGTTTKEEAVNVSPKYVNDKNEDDVMNTGGHIITTEEDEIGEEDINGNHQTDEEDLGYIVRSEKEWARRHRFMSIDRLNIFSDAVFAAITTFMVSMTISSTGLLTFSLPFVAKNKDKI